MAGSLPRNRGNRNSDRMGAMTSRRLRAAGFNVSPAGRRHLANGLFVSGKTSASILVDFGTVGKNNRVTHELFAELTSWPQVDQVTYEQTLDGSATLMWVSFKPKTTV